MSKKAANSPGAKGEKTRHYYAAYGCERDPFSDGGISGLFFPGGGRRKIVEELLHYARFSHSPILLLGKPGAGKSTLLRQLVDEADRDMEVAHIEAEIMQSERQLLESILHGFRQQVTGEKSPFDQFADWLQSQSARRRYSVLCLDNAHNLSAEFLQPFFELVDRPGSLFRLVLSGEKEVQSLLESLASHCELTLNALELPAYNEQVVREYADYRLRAAGFNGDSPFSDIQVKAAQRRSNGNINQLNQLLRDMLIAGSDYRRRMDFDFPAVNLAIVLMLVLLLALVFFAGDRQSEPVAEQRLPLQLEPARVMEEPPGEAPASTPAVGEHAGDDGSQAVATTSSDVREYRAPPESRDVVQSRHDALADKPANVVLAADTASDEVPEPAVQAPDTPPAEVAKAAAPLQAPASTVDSQQLAVSRRLQSWPELGYALQIFGTHNDQRARQLVEQYFGQADLLFYETLHNGKPWFVVINGPYSGRQAAQQSISSLPESLQRLRPWPRNIASIKSDIERYHKMTGDSAGP